MEIPIIQRKSQRPDFNNLPVHAWKAEKMYGTGYRFVGRHSAIKTCDWTRESIKDKNVCYKCKFYGIGSHQCMQMSPSVFWCNFNCMHCWRSLQYTLPPVGFEWDAPETILDGCIDEQRKLLEGYWGYDSANKKKLEDAMMPKHVAISLSGEPTLYPMLPEFIDLIIERGMTAYLVTNGTKPDMIRTLTDHQPTNLYMTLPAPNKELYSKETVPIIKDGWERIQETMSLFRLFSCRTVLRLTLNRRHNMFFPEQYAEMIERCGPTNIECKGYMAVGGAREKMGVEAMPLHNEIVKFAEEIEKRTSYHIVNQKEDSRVVLLER